MRELRNKELTKMMTETHDASRGTYGWPRVRSENLSELVEAILDDVWTSWGDRYALRIEWIVGVMLPKGRPSTMRSPLPGPR